MIGLRKWSLTVYQRQVDIVFLIHIWTDCLYHNFKLCIGNIYSTLNSSYSEPWYWWSYYKICKVIMKVINLRKINLFSKFIHWIYSNIRTYFIANKEWWVTRESNINSLEYILLSYITICSNRKWLISEKSHLDTWRCC